MSQTLGFSANNLDATNERNKSILQALRTNQKVQLEIANAIYADRSTPFNKSFFELCNQSYQSTAYNRDFQSPAIIGEINQWASEKTHGKIPTIISSIAPEQTMVILNAIYFKGNWAVQFHKAETMDDKFQLPSGQNKTVRMMHQLTHYDYLKGDNFQSIKMPYAGRKQSMYIFLPNKGVGLSEFRSQLNSDNWEKWRSQFVSHKINLSMPRFKFDFDTSLKQTLQAMGMREAFVRGKANFSKMIAAPAFAWIGDVVQKTFMEVNEEGTEAAAVTAVMMCSAPCAVMEDPIVEFRVDHPFIVMLVDDQTGELLFVGSIVNP
jgi:serpin B